MAILPYVGLAVAIVSVFAFIPWCRRLLKRLLGLGNRMDRSAQHDTPPPAHFPGYTYCPLCASKLELREVCDRPRLACTGKRCRFVHWDNPKPVALCLVEHEGGLVLTRRRYPPRVGTWCIPGGFVEAHEAPDLAAKRETWEETGLLVEITSMLGVYSPSQGGNEVVIVYTARTIGGALKAGEEVLEIGAFKQNELPAEIGFPQHLEIIEYWFKGDLSARGQSAFTHCDKPDQGK